VIYKDVKNNDEVWPDTVSESELDYEGFDYSRSVFYCRLEEVKS
jgi:hypothetical protein